MFGEKVKYIESKHIYRVMPWLLPHFDLWHSIHQLSRYRPSRFWTKNILTIHDLNYLYEKRGKKVQKYHDRVQKRINRADYLTTISHFTKEDVENHMIIKNKPLLVIYNGVEQPDLSLAQVPKNIQDPAHPFFFTIGQIREKKNFHTLLDLMKMYPDYKLYIAGQDHSHYAKMMKTRIIDEKISNISFLGIISPEEKTWLYTNCKAFLFPSLFEGFGLPVIEAMMFGKPVFCSRKTSLAEVGGNYAFFWDTFETEAMKKVMDEHLDEFYNTPKAISNTINYALSFNYENHMQQYFDLYRTILSTTRKKLIYSK